MSLTVTEDGSYTPTAPRLGRTDCLCFAGPRARGEAWGGGGSPDVPATAIINISAGID